jgi:hypothetical protein
MSAKPRRALTCREMNYLVKSISKHSGPAHQGKSQTKSWQEGWSGTIGYELRVPIQQKHIQRLHNSRWVNPWETLNMDAIATGRGASCAMLELGGKGIVNAHVTSRRRREKTPEGKTIVIDEPIILICAENEKAFEKWKKSRRGREFQKEIKLKL